MDISKVADKSKIVDTKLGSAQTTKAKETAKTDSAQVNQSIKGLTAGVFGAGDKVKWSEDAELAAQATADVKAAPDTRAEKVAQLKASIKNGTYKVDAHKVADKMIQESLEEDLLTRKA